MQTLMNRPDEVVITPIKYYFPVEVSESEVIDMSNIMQSLKSTKSIPNNANLGMFVTNCFRRGLNEYMKEINVDE